MGRRFVESICLAAAVVAVIALVKLAPVPVTGQTATQTPPGPSARTPWGEPDLQGIWTNDYETPLQRPARYANKEFFTDQERAELDRLRTGLLTEDNRPHSRQSEQDVGGAYNAGIFLTHKHTGRRTSLIADPPDGRIPPVTDELKKRREAMRDYQLALLQATDVCKNNMPGCQGGKYGPPSPRRAEPPPYYPTGSINRSDNPEDRGLSERCMAARLPDFGGAAGFFLQVVQSPGTVSIFYDTGQGQGWQRTIPVTDRPHLPPQVRQWWGDSRVSPKTDFQGSGENLHLVERWRRVDAKTMDYVVTMDDGTTWTKPWTVKQELSRQDDKANRIYKEPRCHEGNYGMPALLAGARAEEKAFAEGRGPHPATICTSGCGGFEVAGIGDLEIEEGAPPPSSR
jgi:hypothetical protein